MPELRKHAHLFVLALAILALGASAFFYSTAYDAVPGIPESRYDDADVGNAPSPDAPEEPSDAIACAEAGGVWNPCASACPDAGPDDFCIELCVERCEGLELRAKLPIFYTINALSSRTEPECDEVYPLPTDVTREDVSVPWPEAALRALLEGPGDSELAMTNIPDSVSLLSLEVDKGTARADFSAELNRTAGSCRVSAIRAQIEKTLTRFTEIDKVVISVEGNSEEALQP